MSDTNKTPDESNEIVVVNNWINGVVVKSSDSSDSSEYMDITNPATDAVIGRVQLSDANDVHDAVSAAAAAFPTWSTRYTIKSRSDILRKFHTLVVEHSESLAQCIVQENGKNIVEARADIAKGCETLEYAIALGVSTLASGRIQTVSSGPIDCQDVRKPLGVVVSIVPFNFPFMVPMWTIPIALVLGNTVIVKPSEKVPMTLYRCIALFQQAGLPHGCLNFIQGTRIAVEALIAHAQVKAVTFVGSSPVAAAVSSQCRTLYNKRCTALGGAKNHLVALSDCDIATTAHDIVVSFAGCAGQRCMAASVLLLVGDDQTALVEQIVQLASAIVPGTGPGQMGPVIDRASYDKIISYIELATEKDGATLLLDGRSWATATEKGGGNWIGPTILLHKSSTDRTICEEVFGPVLSVYVCTSWQEAMDIEHCSPFGNAAAIYTTNGGSAQWFTSRFHAAMLGINIGIPVPREPFSFGGLYGTCSKYGDMDITGDGGIEFFTHRIKITSKWPVVPPNIEAATTTAAMTTTIPTTTTQNGTTTAMSNSNSSGGGGTTETVDQASFAGSM